VASQVCQILILTCTSLQDGGAPDHMLSETMEGFWHRVGNAWNSVVDISREQNGQNVAVVAPPSVSPTFFS
jgi:hypothetical protein